MAAARVKIALAADPQQRKALVVPQTASMADVLAMAAKKLNVPEVAWLRLRDNCTIEDPSELRDNDEVLAGLEDMEWSSVSAAASPGPMARQTSVVSTRKCFERRESDADWVRLSVGGVVYVTTRDTLVKDPDSMLARMFGSDTWKSHTDDSGAYLIDRSPRYFEPVLNFLRHGRVIIDNGMNPSGLLEEAQFFNVQSLVKELEPHIAEYNSKRDQHVALKRQDFLSFLLATSANDALRCQGVNFEGADLSKLDLRNINFKLANLRGANLSNCNLTFCNFERANLEGAVLDQSNLMGCILSRANLENASMRDCNFNDPSQCTTTTLEGAVLRGADLEDSNLSCVNMRVACLKNARLANCNLRCANLAGTDLGNCDLSGCNLQGANLRGANTIGAKFHKMPEAVHMSQSVFSHVGAFTEPF